MGQRHVCTFRHAQRAAYRTAISAAQTCHKSVFLLAGWRRNYPTDFHKMSGKVAHARHGYGRNGWILVIIALRTLWLDCPTQTFVVSNQIFSFIHIHFIVSEKVYNITIQTEEIQIQQEQLTSKSSQSLSKACP